MRFLYTDKIEAETLEADVAILGMGLAGMYCALNLDPKLRIVIVNKLGEDECNSMHAQGGIASVTLKDDSIEDHVRDTLIAGAGLCDEHAVRVLVTEGPENMKQLAELGVPFDHDINGDLSITREGAHSHNRILHCGGDATGKYVTQTMDARVHERGNITELADTALIDVLTDAEGGAAGVLLQQGEKLLTVRCPNVVMATGGIGRIYRNSTNAIAATGDGIAAAMRAGAVVDNMEFVQFHPTALIHPGVGGRYFLISEAMRGEGAILRNRRWDAFMKEVHPLADLAPRDVVSRAIIREMKKYDLPNVYLDITARPRDFLQKRFPTIYAECMKYDIDIAVNWIPVIPVQHYFMGGIKTDTDGATNIPGLYAIGECACTGIHGANRLASNSLLECVVFGRRCARHINAAARNAGAPVLPEPVQKPTCDLDIHTLRSQIRVAMTKKCGILRNQSDMSEALGMMVTIKEQLEGFDLASTPRAMESMNMLTVAEAVLRAAIARKDSVGAHYRTDCEN